MEVIEQTTHDRVTQSASFRLEEATIDELHQAIPAGQTSCLAVVRHYLARVRAFNGVASARVTQDGAPTLESTGTVRAGAPLRFPCDTVKATTILPNLDRYRGPPLEFGRMEATASDPSVQQQFGMIVGIPNARQVNALATLNIRGERSVTCRGEIDRHPSLGQLPPGAPPVCEFFRHLPDALERAMELDPPTGGNQISKRCQCMVPCSRSRTRSIPRTCAQLAAETRPMISAIESFALKTARDFRRMTDGIDSPARCLVRVTEIRCANLLP
jgi:hypothetical protein